MSHSQRLRRMPQKSAYSSPWSMRARLAMGVWAIVNAGPFRFSPKPFNALRLWLLRCFGARIWGKPFVSQSARIRVPWNLELHDRACIGERADVYNLGWVSIGREATVAQECLLCGGTHDFDSPRRELLVGDIIIGAEAFVGTRACVLPGIAIGEGAIVGACAVVTKDVAPWTVNAGNPCRALSHRTRNRP